MSSHSSAVCRAASFPSGDVDPRYCHGESAAGAGLSSPRQPESFCQLTPCTASPRHVLAAPAKLPVLVWQDVLPWDELWHLTCLSLTACSPWGFPLSWPALSSPSDVLEEPSLSSSGIPVLPWTSSTPGAALQRRWDQLQVSLFPPQKPEISVRT